MDREERQTMRILSMDYRDLKKKMQETRKTVVYGAGMIGQIVVPYLFEKYDLPVEDMYYVDKDTRKCGCTIEVKGRQVPVMPFCTLEKEAAGCFLLITNSNCIPVAEELGQLEALRDTDACVIPVMQLEYNQRHRKNIEIIKLGEMRIPKRIHYCWFSGNPIPEKLRTCLDSWKEFCPDYEIIRWDESNYDIDKNRYMREAYDRKKWGFVPDIARLDLLYRFGGIYLDTDVELIRNLDELLYQDAFTGVENWGNINFGGGSGAVAGHAVIKEILDARWNEPFIYEDGTPNLQTCGIYETRPLVKRGMRIDNSLQKIDGLTIYPSDVFHPFDYMSGKLEITENTFSIHYFNGGWLDKNAKEQRIKLQKTYDSFVGKMKDSVACVGDYA